jgi:hypothetical protein
MNPAKVSAGPPTFVTKLPCGARSTLGLNKITTAATRPERMSMTSAPYYERDGE